MHVLNSVYLWYKNQRSGLFFNLKYWLGENEVSILSSGMQG